MDNAANTVAALTDTDTAAGYARRLVLRDALVNGGASYQYETKLKNAINDLAKRGLAFKGARSSDGARHYTLSAAGYDVAAAAGISF